MKNNKKHERDDDYGICRAHSPTFYIIFSFDSVEKFFFSSFFKNENFLHPLKNTKTCFGRKSAVRTKQFHFSLSP